MDRSIYFKALLFIFIASFLLLAVVSANGAKPMQDPSGNGGFIFDENPEVALLNETVSFDLKDSANINWAIVTVEYEMKNLLEKDQSFDMFFVVPYVPGSVADIPYSVSLDGTDITENSYYQNINLPNNWQPKFREYLIEPYSKEVYDTNFGRYDPLPMTHNNSELNGINIPIAIKAGSTAKLVVQYICEGGYNRTEKFHNTIYNFMYYLTPAKYWNEEPKVTLNVALPEEQQYAFYSSIPMEAAAKNFYTAKLGSLPDYEWVFSFVDKQGIIYGTNLSENHAIITIFISAAIFIIALIAAWRLKSRNYMIFGYILAVVYFYIFKGKLVDGYIGEFLLMLPISFVLLLLIPISYYAYHKRK